MSLTDEPTTLNWWATGDTPVRTGSRVTYLIDGRSTMLTMCRHFLKARGYIYLATWGLTPTMELVRGQDHRVGPDGSPQQEALLTELRADGLQQPDIEFWTTQNLTVQAVLGYAVSKGIEVKVLLWDAPDIFSHYKPKEAYQQLIQVGVTCILDGSAHGITHHPIESLHQKIAIVDGTYAFVGGIDPLIELSGDFDRWDIPSHLFSLPFRVSKTGTSPHPWHDVHSLIEGPAAADVEYNFRQRWNDVLQHHHWNTWQPQGFTPPPLLPTPQHPFPPPVPSNSIVQIARTIPEHTYSFDPPIIRGIAQHYANAFSNIQHFVYLENQYLWLRAYTGIDIPFISINSPEMEHNLLTLANALQRGATLALLLPDHPNAGRGLTDAGLARLRAQAPEAATQGRIQLFCLGTSATQEDGEHYRPIYVHAKVAVIDDLWSTVGSANLNNRGMRDDTEMNVAVLDAELAYGLRLMLWAEHLGLVNDNDLFILARYLSHQQQQPEDSAQAARAWGYLQETLGDPLLGLRLMIEQAQNNLRRYKAKQPLEGHLLPYLTAEEAAQEGVPFRESHGWVEEP